MPRKFRRSSLLPRCAHALCGRLVRASFGGALALTLVGCDGTGASGEASAERTAESRRVASVNTAAAAAAATSGAQAKAGTQENSESPASMPGADDAPSSAAIAADQAASAAGVASATPAPRDDAPLADHRRALLHLSFEIASRIPLQPHVKDRAKAQAAVVDAALELDQARLARAFAETMPTWRRGNAFSDIAFHLAERGDTETARQLLAVAAAAMEEEPEEWRRNRIRAGIARTYALLGEGDAAARLAADLDDAEIGRAEGARAIRADSDRFDEHLEWVDQAAAVGTIDLTAGALDVATGLFDRFYDDSERRRAAEAAIRAGWHPLPILLRVELLSRLTEIALEHGDQAKALALVEETDALISGHAWVPEDHVTLGARVAGLRHRAGDPERARRDLDRLVVVYEEGLPQIGIVFRSGVLRALAEALVALDAAADAAAMYGRSIDVALANPNARPRAEDLSAIARSLALADLDPVDLDRGDAADGAHALDAIMIRLHDGRDGLTAPW